MTTYRTWTGLIDVQVGDVIEYDDDGATIRVEVTHVGPRWIWARWVCTVMSDGRAVRGDGQEALLFMWLHDWKHVR